MLPKNKIIFLGALAVTILISIPRLLIAIARPELPNSFTITLEDTLIRGLMLFVYAWVLLSYNIKWRFRIAGGGSFLRNSFINILILFFGVLLLTVFGGIFEYGGLLPRQLFMTTLFLYVIVMFILLLLSRVVIVTEEVQRNIREKEQARQEALYHQLEALRNQVNPHFLFNALNSLNALIRQDSDKAPVFVDKLSWLLRQSLQHSEEDFVSLKEELDYLEAYIFLQKERFGKKLDVTVDIPEDWNRKNLPSFSLQLLVENAIKHNIVSEKEPLKINIYTEDQFVIVHNLIKKRRDVVESTGHGLNSVSKRFLHFNEKEVLITETENDFIVKLPMP